MSEDGNTFFNKQEFACFSFDVVSGRINHVELWSSYNCFLTSVDLIFVSSRNMKGNENFKR